MVDTLFLTILISCYNGERFLKDCLPSIAAQTADKAIFQIIIVDDGSIDNSWKIIEDFASYHQNVLTLHYSKNQGLPFACNVGLKHITTPYFVRLDVDDYILPHFVETIKNTIALIKADFYISDRYELCGNEKKLVADLADDIYKWIASGTVFDTRVVKKLGGYSNEYWEEYDLYLRLLEAGYKFHYIKKPLYVYRKHSQSMTSDFLKKKMGWQSLKRKWSEKTLLKYGSYKKYLFEEANQ